MANVLNRNNPLDYRISVNTPEYDVKDWIINPDLSNVNGISQKYWKISGDNVIEMDAGEKLAVDTAIIASIDLKKSVLTHSDKVLKSALLVLAEQAGLSQEDFETLQKAKYNTL